MSKVATYIISFICFAILSIESRKNLRDYVVSPNYLPGLRRDELSVYDQSEKNLLCQLQLSNYPLNQLTNYPFNQLSNLISYPSYQTIASIRNVWSPFLYPSYMINVLDDETNSKWTSGQIYQRYRPQGLRFSIRYGNKYYTMENKVASLITEIRDDKRPNYVLTRFYEKNVNPLFGSSKYNVQIYTDDLPDPVYILALYALDLNLSRRRRIQFIP